MNIAIIGCGLIGRKRALALQADDKLIACCDSNPEVSENFGKEFFCDSYTDYNELLRSVVCDSVIVAVVNKYAMEIVNAALNSGNHVIAEKPLGRNLSEAESMVNTAMKNKRILKTGFNHRFHPAVWKAKELFDTGTIGKLMFIRGRYGHGGRPGMEHEWRASKDLCGGGEMLDQGVHLIDLCRWFAGEIKNVFGKVKTKFWQMNVEDNAFITMESVSGADILLQVSWTNWKNIFSFEIFGTDGYLRIEGLGGSYGPETLELGLRKKEGGKPEVTNFDFPVNDISWIDEWKEFKKSVQANIDPIGNGRDGLMANAIIGALYKSSETGMQINL